MPLVIYHAQHIPSQILLLKDTDLRFLWNTKPDSKKQTAVKYSFTVLFIRISSGFPYHHKAACYR